jgi:hypothetical protein
MYPTHLGLPIADERRSALFYQAYFGFDPLGLTVVASA